MVNVNKLKGKIVENELTVEEVAKAAGMTKDTLYRRFKNPEYFTIAEMNVLTEALHLTAEEALSIFFAQYVS